MNSFADIIAAVSTPPGKGGVAIIRVSGCGSLALAEKFFFAKSKKPLGEYPPRTLVYGYIISKDGGKIDDGMICYFKEGASYTGEETVEITSHGGTLVTSMVLERVLECGARLAEAGEFTRRAFVNGKIALSDAESIGMLLDAKTREQVALAGEDARERLKEAVSKIRVGLTEILSSSYARIDYPDEDLGDFSNADARKRLLVVRDNLTDLINTYKTGRAICDGINTVICGKPNTGKSTVFNMILGFDAAIVTDIKGTTTDVLTSTATLGRVTLNLADTAGLRTGDSVGVVEKIGIERARSALSSSDLAIAVFDLSRAFDKEDEDVLAELEGADGAKIALLNKSDLSPTLFDKSKIDGKFDTVLTVCAKDRETALSQLSDIINKMFTDERIRCGESAIISSARQNAALLSALNFINFALEALESGYTQDMISSDIERALRAVAEADGREVSEAVTDDIFAKFCVGK